MAIILNKPNIFEGVPTEEMAAYFISRLDLCHAYAIEKVNERGEIKAGYYKGSVFFFEEKELNEANINKLNEVAKIISNAYSYSKENGAGTVNSGEIYFHVKGGEIELHLISPNKDNSVDFNRKEIFKSIKISRDEHIIKEETNRLLSAISEYSSSTAKLETNTSPNINFSDIELNLANDNDNRVEAAQQKNLKQQDER